MKHFLDRIEIVADQYDRLQEIARRCLDGARVRAEDGTWIFQPDGGGKYGRNMYTRDFCYAVEGAGHLIPPEEIAAACEYIFTRQREDGLMPNRVAADGTPIYVVNENNPALNYPPADNAQFAVKLMRAYMDLTRDWEFFSRWSHALMDAMETVVLSEDHLVEIDPADPRPGYGFTDTVAKTGEVLFSSLLYWEACMLLAGMCKQVEDHDGVHTWFEAAEHTARNLHELDDGKSDMFLAASRDCRQVDLWGSAYAGVVRAASKSHTKRIGEFFFDRYDDCILRGCVRHVPAPATWERMLADYPPGTYQNGGYWPTASGWVAKVLDKYDPATARTFVDDVIEELDEGNAPEWISDDRREAPLYVASAANVLGAVKRARS
ncbi:MAG TPA: hypothetical protein VM283_00490 [Armatimonadota bacterium]|nr:hypothetical protein [Armatimonadota bacterium]